MGAYRNFDRVAEEVAGDPVEFGLAGQDFKVYDLPVGALMRALGQSELVLYKEAFKAMLPDDYYRFEEALIRSRFGVAELDEMMGWLMEQVAARPTKRPSDSPPSPPETGPNLSLASEPSPSLVAFS